MRRAATERLCRASEANKDTNHDGTASTTQTGVIPFYVASVAPLWFHFWRRSASPIFNGTASGAAI
jgi:hypothetical protein